VKFELYIQGHDKPHPKQIKFGDIVTARPYPWSWGLNEIKFGLIIIVDIPFKLNPMPDISTITKPQIARFLRKTGIWFRLKINTQETIEQVFGRLNSIPLNDAKLLVRKAWESNESDRIRLMFRSELLDFGIYSHEVIKPDLDNSDLAIAKTIYEDPVICTSMNFTDSTMLNGKVWRNNPEVIAKRKFNLPTDRLLSFSNNEIDIEKINDTKYIYQPFKSASQVISAFDGKNKNYLLDLKDVDCKISGAIDDNQEIVFNWRKLTDPIPFEKWNRKDEDPEEITPPDLDVD